MFIPSELVEELFQKVVREAYEREVNFQPIEEELGKLKKGGSLTYDHLELIADEKYWDFSKWWRWPQKNVIEEELKKTEGMFIKLKEKDKDPETGREIINVEEARKIFNKLYYHIFKHIELVSIILRFIDPENYAIYSPPITFYLNVPRGYVYWKEYFNYIEELRKYMYIYHIKKVSYAERFIWALSMSNWEKISIKDEILDYFHSEIKEESVKRRAKELFENIELTKKTEYEKAKFYMDIESYNMLLNWEEMLLKEK